MNVRKMVSLLVAAPALLVALSNPAGAATPGVLVFSGTLEITPTAAPDFGETEFCFFTASSACANGVGSTGAVAGAGAAPAPEVLDGLQGKAIYSETCVELDVPAIGRATITANVHRAVPASWSAPVTAQWFRAGLVAVIQGDGTGAAVFAPMGELRCGKPAQVAVSGAVELTY